MQAASHQEIDNAKSALQRYGYEVSTHENGHLIVQDPVHRSGSEGLIFVGCKPVAIRSYSEARRFINARS